MVLRTDRGYLLVWEAVFRYLIACKACFNHTRALWEEQTDTQSPSQLLKEQQSTAALPEPLLLPQNRAPRGSCRQGQDGKVPADRLSR